MKYRVIWTRTAKSELAAAWLAAPDRNAVAAASHSVEQLLIASPFAFSESRESFLDRVAFESPLGIWYVVVPDDEKVIIQHVWLHG